MRWTPLTYRHLVLLIAIFSPGVACASALEWDGLGGSLENVGWCYLQPYIGADTCQDRLDAVVSSGVSYGAWRAKLSPWGILRAPPGIAGAWSETGVKPELELKEGWLEYRGDSWDVRAGNQLISWGAADRINPTDLWNPQDYTDPLIPHKLPLLTARASVHPEAVSGLSLEWLFAPLYREPALPVLFPDSGTASVSTTGSRWLLPFPVFLQKFGATLPLDYEVGTPSFPSGTWQTGGRLRIGWVQGWDFSISYLNSVERFPRIHAVARGNANLPSLPITVTLYPSYHREQVLGLDGVGAILEGAVTLRFEAAYHFRDNSDVPIDSPDLLRTGTASAVAGFDYTLPWHPWGTTTYFDTMGVIYRESNPGVDEMGLDTLQNPPNVLPWDGDWVLYLEERITPQLKLSGTLIWSLQNQDAYLRGGASRRIGDSVEVSLDGDFFMGSTSGFYGQFYDNNRVRLGVQVSL